MGKVALALSLCSPLKKYIKFRFLFLDIKESDLACESRCLIWYVNLKLVVN